MTTTTIEAPAISHALAGEIRAELGRQGLNQTALAARLGRSQIWLSRRIGLNGTVNITLEEAAEMADALGVSAEGIIVAALRACRDSNPKPSDWESDRGTQAVNRRLTVNGRDRSAWALAA